MCRSSATASTAAIRTPAIRCCVIDLDKRKRFADIDLSPYVAPHTVRLGADGLIYITCENSAKVGVIDPKTNKVIGAIDSGSTNGHRLCIRNDGRRLYTDNEEDATVSVIDLPNRKLLGKIATPQPIAGVAVSGDGATVVAVSDESPVVFMIDMRRARRRTSAARRRGKAAQIARYSPDDKLLVVSSLNSNTVSLIETASRRADRDCGRQPADGLRLPRRRNFRRLPGRRHDPHHRRGEPPAQDQLQGRRRLQIRRIFLIAIAFVRSSPQRTQTKLLPPSSKRRSALASRRRERGNEAGCMARKSLVSWSVCRTQRAATTVIARMRPSIAPVPKRRASASPPPA